MPSFAARPVALLLSFFFLLATTPLAAAAAAPLPGVRVEISKKHCHNCSPITTATDETGTINLPNLAPGEYEFAIIGQSLAVAAKGMAARISIVSADTPDTTTIPALQKTLSAADVPNGVTIAFTIPKKQHGANLQIITLPAGEASTPVVVSTDAGSPAIRAPQAEPPATKPVAPSPQKPPVADAPMATAATPAPAASPEAAVPAAAPCKPISSCVSNVAFIVKNSKGGVVAQGQTGATGTAQIHFNSGDSNSHEEALTIQIDGPSLVAAMDKIPPPATSGKKKGFSINMGGLGGGESTRQTPRPATAKPLVASLLIAVRWTPSLDGKTRTLYSKEIAYSRKNALSGMSIVLKAPKSADGSIHFELSIFDHWGNP